MSDSFSVFGLDTTISYIILIALGILILVFIGAIYVSFVGGNRLTSARFSSMFSIPTYHGGSYIDLVEDKSIKPGWWDDDNYWDVGEEKVKEIKDVFHPDLLQVGDYFGKVPMKRQSAGGYEWEIKGI
jgi:hypothetical protein